MYCFFIDCRRGIHYEYSCFFLFFDPVHLEACGECVPVLILALGGPAHHVAVDGDLPALTFLLTVFNPAHAELVAILELLAQRVVGRYPFVALFDIVDIGAVGLVFPVVILTVISLVL